MDLQLKGKRALVTGGSRGLGKAIAWKLAVEGVDCAVCGRNSQTLEAAAQELASVTGREVVPIVADMTKPDQIQRLVETAAEALGGIDILVNNGARVSGAIAEDFARVEDEQILADFEEKFLGYFRCARAVVPHMRKGGWGRIVNISGAAARNAGSISAGARNASVVHLTKTLASELGRDGINANAIYPAVTVTETLDQRLTVMSGEQSAGAEVLKQQLGSRNAIGRLVTAEEVANVVCFLASPLSVGITGEVLAVTGGAGSAVYY